MNTKLTIRWFLIAGLIILVPGTATHAQIAKQANIDARRNSARMDKTQVQRVGERFRDWNASNTVLREHDELRRVRGLDIDQILAYDELDAAVPSLRISWESGLPIFIEGAPLQRSRAQLTAPPHDATTPHLHTAAAFFRNFSSLLRIDPEGMHFLLRQFSADERGRTHLRFGQLRDGIPVWGKEVVCGIAANGDLDLFAGRYAPADRPVRGEFSIEAGQAAAAALAHVGSRTEHAAITETMRSLLQYAGPETERCYVDENGTLLPAFVVELRPNALERWRCFVNAATGAVIRAYPTNCADGPEKSNATDLSGTGREIDTYLHQGSYYMIDASRPMFDAGSSVFPDRTTGTITTLSANNTDLTNVTHTLSADNSWSDASTVSAHYNLGIVYEYFRTTHGRNSLDGDGGTIYAICNVTQGGASMPNAFWNGQFIAFGNGGSGFAPFAGALDITAHELAHGVTEHSAGLEYRNQSGALNEAFSDIFGAMVDREDWLIGEDVTPTNSSFPTGAARDMENPHNGGSQGSPSWQPKHMNEYQNLPESQDNGGVHINSGIINHCAYLLSLQIGRDKAERIFYDALTTKLTRQSQFIDFRLAIIRSAAELYGATESSACAAACDQVGITDGNPSDDPKDLPGVEGQDRMLFVNTDPFLPAPLWIVVPPATSNDDFSSVSFTEIWSRPSIDDNGSVAVFVDSDYNIRAIALDGPANEQVLENSGVWNSIALSRDQNLLAITTILENPEIYVLDISGPSPVTKSFDVYTPNYTGESIPNTAQFADAMEFSHSGEYLLFDTYNEVEINGYELGFWDINLMHIWNAAQSNFGTGVIERIFPQDPSVSIGNPTFAKNKPTVIAFDVVFPERSTSYIMAMDMRTVEPQVVTETTFGQNGYPSYAGDDRRLSFVGVQQNLQVIYNIPIGQDGISATGPAEGFVAAGTMPVWFRTGTRPVSVEGTPAAAAEPALAQNYPNPFNPVTTIRYTLPERATVMLTVHDVLGRRIQVLDEGMRDQGGHVAVWDGSNSAGQAVPSGTYIARLVVGDRVLTRQMLLLK